MIQGGDDDVEHLLKFMIEINGASLPRLNLGVIFKSRVIHLFNHSLDVILFF